MQNLYNHRGFSSTKFSFFLLFSLYTVKIWGSTNVKSPPELNSPKHSYFHLKIRTWHISTWKIYQTPMQRPKLKFSLRFNISLVYEKFFFFFFSLTISEKNKCRWYQMSCPSHTGSNECWGKFWGQFVPEQLFSLRITAYNFGIELSVCFRWPALKIIW